MTFTLDHWIDSLHEDANGLVWTTKPEIRAAVEAALAAVPAHTPGALDVETAKRWARWINEVGEALHERGRGDWACSECQPESDILIEGFRCVYHEALAYEAASPSEETR